LSKKRSRNQKGNDEEEATQGSHGGFDSATGEGRPSRMREQKLELSNVR